MWQTASKNAALRADPFTFEVEKITLLHLVDISCYKNLSLRRVERISLGKEKRARLGDSSYTYFIFSAAATAPPPPHSRACIGDIAV